MKYILRSWLRKPFISSIMLLGLGIAFAAAWLILYYVQFEYHFDSHIPEHEYMYMVGEQPEGVDNTWYYTRASLWPGMREQFPELAGGTRILPGVEMDFSLELQRFRERGMYVDTSFFTLMDIPLLQGNSTSCLSQPNSVVLTQSLAEKYFPNGNALNQSIEVNYDHFLVTGIIEDFPIQSSFSGDYLLGHSLRDSLDPGMVNWYATSIPILLKLKPGSSPEELGDKITALVEKHTGEYYNGSQFSLLPLSNYRTQDPTYAKQLRIIGWIGILVLLIASINVSNLLTAGSYTRLRGLGVKKTLGASKGQIRWQLIRESLLLASIGSILGFVLADILFPVFAELMELPSLSQIPFSLTQILIMVALTLAIGVFTGAYPAWYLPKVSIPSSLKGKLPKDPKGTAFQNGLVLLQFGVSAVLLIGALFVHQQLKFMKEKELHIDTEQILSIQLDPEQFAQPERVLQYIPQLKARLETHAQIAHVSSSMFVPYHNYMWGNMMESEKTGEQFHLHFGVVDEDFPELFDLQLAQGKFFADSLGGQSQPQMLVNETFVQSMGWEEAVGKQLEFIDNSYEIVGVVKDFHFTSLDQPIKPLLYLLGSVGDQGWWGWHQFISVKIQEGSVGPVMAYVNKELDLIDPTFPFESFFVDEEYQSLYQYVAQRSTLASILSFLAIGISLMGLLGLMSYMTYQHTKEIGIRKILGATVTQLIQHFTGKFSFPLLLGTILALPISYLMVSNWLEDFAYRIPILPGNFLIGMGITLSIALIIILQYVFQVANMHPVEALRDE